MSTYTSGPWALVRDPKRGVAIQARAGSPSAAHIAYVQFTGTDLEDGLANAHLIAAAPDLLAACRSAEEILDGALSSPARASALVTLRAAIAKAEGR